MWDTRTPARGRRSPRLRTRLGAPLSSYLGVPLIHPRDLRTTQYARTTTHIRTHTRESCAHRRRPTGCTFRRSSAPRFSVFCPAIAMPFLILLSPPHMPGIAHPISASYPLSTHCRSARPLHLRRRMTMLSVRSGCWWRRLSAGCADGHRGAARRGGNGACERHACYPSRPDLAHVSSLPPTASGCTGSCSTASTGSG